MVRLDDDELNISPAVAGSLGYAPARHRRRPAVAPAPAAPRRPGRDVADAVGWIIAGIFGLFGSLILFTVICFAISIVSGAAPTTTAAGMSARPQIAESVPSTSPVPQHPITSQSAPEPQSAADLHPAAQPQLPPAIETTNPETDSQQTMQSPPQSESVPNNVEASSSLDPSSTEPEKSEITVEETIQQKRVEISQPPESEQHEGKVKFPMTKWAAEKASSSPPFSSWRWVCASRNGLRCGLQDVNGTYVQRFFWNGGSVQASEISKEALFPRGLAWRCARMPGLLYCTILDSRGTNRQGCAYDGRSLACGN